MIAQGRRRVLLCVAVATVVATGCMGEGPEEDPATSDPPGWSVVTEGADGEPIDPDDLLPPDEPQEEPVPSVPADAPSVDDLLAALPGVDALPAGPWDREAGPSSLDEDLDDALPLCHEGAPGHPLGALLFLGHAEGGAGVLFSDPDESARLTVTLAPMAGAAALIASARDDVAACSIAAGDVTEALPWPPVGDASVAFGQPEGTRAAPGELAGGVRTVLLLAHVGDVVIALRLEVVTDDGSGRGPLLGEAELQPLAADLAGRLDGG